MKLKFIKAVVFLCCVINFFDLNAQHNPYSEVPREIAPLNTPFKMDDLVRPDFPNKEYSILNYGAKEKGVNNYKCTDAINDAIIHASKSGGGKVIIPKGDWLTGPIHLKSNINLHIEEGATIYFSEDKSDYLPVVLYRHEGVETYNYSPLIYAFEVENVAITGKGELDGQGEHWLKWGTVQPRAKATKVPLSLRRNFGKGSGTEGMRPNFIVFWKSKNILVEDITVSNGPMWNVHLIYSQKAIVRGN